MSLIQSRKWGRRLPGNEATGTYTRVAAVGSRVPMILFCCSNATVFVCTLLLQTLQVPTSCCNRLIVARIEDSFGIVLQNSRTIPETRKLHSFVPIWRDTVKVRPFSLLSTSRNESPNKKWDLKLIQFQAM